MTQQESSGNHNSVWFWLSGGLVVATLLAYSQTLSFSWDEGFHLLAAQLIKSGKKPYLDFAFPQTPMNAYWNATWLRLLGDGWRQIHVVAALATASAVLLAVGFLRSRFTGWGTASLIAVLFVAGLNIQIVEFGTVGQAYAFGLLLIVGAFRLAVASVERERTGFGTTCGALAGWLAGTAAGATLLTAPVAPVLLAWIFFFSPASKRWSRTAAFVAGVVVSWLPVVVLYAKSPEQVLFFILRYHLFYRRVDWPGATQHDLEIVTSWITDPQSWILGVLAVAGLWFVATKSGWETLRRQEFYLCGWLALAQAAYLSTAHPTFSRYYIFTVPFLGILAAVGLFAITTQLGINRAWATGAVGLLMCLTLGRQIYDTRSEQSWPGVEKVARKVNEVTPPGASLYADEITYFLTHRTPPSGNEHQYTHKLNMPADFAERMHMVPQAEIDRRIAAGVYDTLETCEEADWIKERKLTELYRQKAEPGDCTVFWDKDPAQTTPPK